MKKIQVYFVALVAVFIVPELMATPFVQPVRTMVIPYASEEITIDGDVEDCYSDSQTTEAYNTVGSTGNDEDFTLTFRVCYNLERLYLAVKILDDYANEIPYTTSTSPWTWDNVEMFLSLDTIGTTAAYDSNTIQLRFNRGIQDSAQTPGRADQDDFDGNVYYENTADGWVLEVGIPWTAVLSDSQEPEDIEQYLTAVHGFDLCGNDSDIDGPGGTDCQVFWDTDDPGIPDATEDLAWNDRTVFGVITLAPVEAVSNPDIESSEFMDVLLFPNPTDQILNIKSDKQIYDLEIIDISGNIILKNTVNALNTGINLDGFSKGIYNLRVNTEAGQITRQFILE